MSRENQPLDNQPPEDTQDQIAQQPEKGDFDTFFNDFASDKTDDTSELAEEEDPPEEGGGEKAQDEPSEPDDQQAAETEEAPELTEREKELQSQLDKLRQSEASQRGRVGALQRQINELRRQQQAPQKSDPPAAKPSTQQTQGESQQQRDQKQAIAEEYGSEDWKAFEQDFPDIAKALNSRFSELSRIEERLNQRMSSVEQSVQPMQEQAHQQYLADQMRALEARHPDWQEVKDAPAFHQWLQQQPESFQQLANSSEDAAEVAAILDAYKFANGAQQASSDDRAAAAQAEREKRNQRLAQSQTPQRRGTGQRQAVPDEFEAAFNHYAQKR